MRIVVYGVGAIGGTIAARLALTGQEVVGIARGAMLQAINANDVLNLVTPGGTQRAHFQCVGDPSELAVRTDDAVILAMKGQHTQYALDRLRSVGYDHQPIVCAQNGVANEPAALRYFPNVYGLMVLMPAQYRVPGTVEAIGCPKHGIFDIGRYPRGKDAFCETFAQALCAADILCDVSDDVMPNKYANLALNVGNMVQAALGSEHRFGPWHDRARAEAEATYRAAGIVVGNVDPDHPRRKLLKSVEIPGAERAGTSSTQSLLRGAGSIETDYLNGEIVLLGRLHAVPTPVNAALVRIAHIMTSQNMKPGAFPEERLAAMVAENN